MTRARQAAFKNPWINGWPLFWALSAMISLATFREMSALHMAAPADVSHMIAYSVRWAVPFIYMVMMATAVPILLPGEFSRWWLRNRKYLGLVFAVAMTWQGAFIFLTSAFHTDYYYSDIYLLRDELEGSSGYIFLAAMVLTSFRIGRRQLSQTQWKLLHKSGVYFLWAYPFSVYWWNVFYYPDPELLDYCFYWGGFAAFALRIAAWGKNSRRSARRANADARTPTVWRALGVLLIGTAVLASATGYAWHESVSALLLSSDWSAALERWLPFWPFEPFLPLFMLGIGTVLFTASKAEEGNQKLAPAS